MLSPHCHLGTFAGERASRCQCHASHESVIRMLAALAVTCAFVGVAAAILEALA